MSKKKTPDSLIFFLWASGLKNRPNILRTYYEQGEGERVWKKGRMRWEKICAGIKLWEKKWMEEQWGTKTVFFVRAEANAVRGQPYSSWAVYEQIMSRLWAGGDTHKKGRGKNSRVDKRKKQNGIENEETRGRKDKVGGEEKIKGLFMSGLWANYERPMSRRYTLQKNEHDEVQLRP